MNVAMNKKNQKYIKNSNLGDLKIVRTEIIFMPLLVVAPFLVGFFLIQDWYIRDYLWDELDLFRQLLLGCIIIIGNILFDIPFIKSLGKYNKEK